MRYIFTLTVKEEEEDMINYYIQRNIESKDRVNVFMLDGPSSQDEI